MKKILSPNTVTFRVDQDMWLLVCVWVGWGANLPHSRRQGRACGTSGVARSEAAPSEGNRGAWQVGATEQLWPRQVDFPKHREVFSVLKNSEQELDTCVVPRVVARLGDLGVS